MPVVVAINRFATDTDAELELVRAQALAAGADDAQVAQHHGKGGAGAVDLAQAVMRACQKPSDFKFTYSLDLSLRVRCVWGARAHARVRVGGWGVTRGSPGHRPVPGARSPAAAASLHATPP